MENKKTSAFSNGLIWFGAAVSIAEILTGTFIAPLGFKKGIAAILLGHIIGCALLYLAGLIGAKTEKSGMETVKLSFGEKGSLLFSILNILQLIGWTAVMIISGAKAVSAVLNPILNIKGDALWSLVIGALILVWILIGVKNLSKVNTVTMGSLFLLTIVLSIVVFGGNSEIPIEGTISFGSAVELSVAMPLSWLPLISDYTRYGQNPKLVTLTSVISYFLASCWMYIIGLGAVIFIGQTDVSQIMLQAGLGLIAVLIIIGSTVTTTFLDVYSAGVSFVSISTKANEKVVAIISCIIGTLLAIFTPIEQFENFLYLIGSVFAPMVAILLTDFFILKKNSYDKSFNILNLVIWFIGFIIYRMFMYADTFLGSTFPVMISISIICILINGGIELCSKRSLKI